MFKNLKLSWKLGLGFGLVLVLTGVVCLIGLKGQNDVSGRVVNMADVNRIIDLNNLSTISQRNYLNTGEQRFLMESKAALSELREVTQSTRDSFQDPANIKQMDDIFSAADSYESELDNYVAEGEKAAEQFKVWFDVNTEVFAIGAEVRDNLIEPGKQRALAEEDTQGLLQWTNLGDSFNQEISRNYLLMRIAALYYLKDRTEEQWNGFEKAMIAMRDGVASWREEGEGIDAAEALGRRLSAAIESYIQAGQAYHSTIIAQNAARARMNEEDELLLQATERALADQEEKLTAEMISARNLMFLATAIALLLGLGAAFVITRGITGPVARGVAFAREIAEGRLDTTIDVHQKDEIGTLADALRSMVEQLRQVVAEVTSASDNVASGSQEMSASSEQLSQGSTEQAASIEEVSSSMEQMAANIRQNADNAHQTEKISVKAAEDARSGGSAVTQTVEAMKDIADKISIIEE
ncbi:MAG: methyl-accepting chemotaxis protein, partial [bacterium]